MGSTRTVFATVEDKATLRKRLRAARKEHAASLPESMRGLVFRHPPAALIEMIPADAVIGLYRAMPGEAPATAYTQFFYERGHTVALPRIGRLDEPMQFHLHTDPLGESDLVEGTMRILQPADDAPKIAPDVLLMPLVGFTERGERLGQGGGFYDRWLADHPATIAIGMAWDCQLVEALPIEDHDQPLSAVVTPTRFYGPF
ncbi:5-formyltetrahydrofolate cyclo-ligase [Altererythrobacter arenosus]|uniref:5-formyltetrahydrofolate cyclo-ligase n=1 Tax=Altererythrobacter arenosus TaxID=3032592 RepID=A0ABY8FVP5_9SPHN|nr:5-formyltetrahydrofolate cyclo-ligase [Altererythrobacter sp. CAU 1644]WFL79080.1 5-formyltetrahydrofolate cyclo-ligase [Altererythrobacter sp. CAU 1644]